MENTEKEVIFEYEYIRRSSVTNMRDRTMVASLADNYEFNALLKVASRRDMYNTLLLQYTRPDETEYQAWLKQRGL